MSIRMFAFAAAGLLLSAGEAFALAAMPTTALNVRVGPSSSTSVLYTLSAGETIDVVSCGSGWCKLNTGGFVSEAYLVPAGSPAPAVNAPAPTSPAYSGGGNGGYYAGDEDAYGGFDDTYGDFAGEYAGYDEGFDQGYGGGDGGWPALAPFDQPNGYNGFGGYPSYRQGAEFRFGSGPDNFPFAFGIESNNPAACFYNHPSYNADAFCRQTMISVPEIRGRWDDRISSIWTSPRFAVQACTGAYFTGVCRTYSGNVPWIGRAMDNDISSYRVVRR
ncbi:MAG: SH3 domain-containing protein [Cucumibacter sp.]